MHMGHMYDEGNCLTSKNGMIVLYLTQLVQFLKRRNENINICSFGLKASKDILKF